MPFRSVQSSQRSSVNQPGQIQAGQIQSGQMRLVQRLWEIQGAIPLAEIQQNQEMSYEWEESLTLSQVFGRSWFPLMRKVQWLNSPEPPSAIWRTKLTWTIEETGWGSNSYNLLDSGSRSAYRSLQQMSNTLQSSVNLTLG